MSATEERREEVNVSTIFHEAEKQVRRGRVDPQLLDAVRGLKPDDAVFLVYALRAEVEDEDLDDESWRALSKVEEAAMPRIAEYVSRVAGVCMPLRARRGWTDKVLEALRGLPAVESFEEADRRGLDEYLYILRDGYAAGVVSWERFKEVLRHVPLEELLGKFENAPRYLDFVEAAAKVPGSYLSVHVIRGNKTEYMIIDGILLPVQKGADEQIHDLLQEADSPPDEFAFVDVKGRQYVWLRWG